MRYLKFYFYFLSFIWSNRIIQIYFIALDFVLVPLIGHAKNMIVKQKCAFDLERIRNMTFCYLLPNYDWWFSLLIYFHRKILQRDSCSLDIARMFKIRYFLKNNFRTSNISVSWKQKKFFKNLFIHLFNVGRVRYTIPVYRTKIFLYKN